jgi:hypothetical protein
MNSIVAARVMKKRLSPSFRPIGDDGKFWPWIRISKWAERKKTGMSKARYIRLCQMLLLPPVYPEMLPQFPSQPAARKTQDPYQHYEHEKYRRNFA